MLAAPAPRSDESNGSRPSISLPKGGGAIRGIGDNWVRSLEHPDRGKSGPQRIRSTTQHFL
jgi:hypothetical protein